MATRRARIKVTPNLAASRSKIKPDIKVCTDHVKKSARIGDLIDKLDNNENIARNGKVQISSKIVVNRSPESTLDNLKSLGSPIPSPPSLNGIDEHKPVEQDSNRLAVNSTAAAETCKSDLSHEPSKSSIDQLIKPDESQVNQSAAKVDNSTKEKSETISAKKITETSVTIEKAGSVSPEADITIEKDKAVSNLEHTKTDSNQNVNETSEAAEKPEVTVSSIEKPETSVSSVDKPETGSELQKRDALPDISGAVKPAATGQFVNGKYLRTATIRPQDKMVQDRTASETADKVDNSLVEDNNGEDKCESDKPEKTSPPAAKLPGPTVRRFLGAKHKFKPNLFGRARQIEEGLKRERRSSGGSIVPRTRKNSLGDKQDVEPPAEVSEARSPGAAGLGSAVHRTRRISSGEKGPSVTSAVVAPAPDTDRKRLRSRSGSNSSGDESRRKIRPPPTARRGNIVENEVVATPLLNLDEGTSVASPRIRRLSDGGRIALERTNYMLKRRKHESKRRFAKGVPGRGTMTMFDLIYYNPDNGTEMNNKDSDQEDAQEQVEESPVKKIKEPELEPEPPVPMEDEDSLPVPQVKVGANGEIILDESSTMLETTAAKKAKEDLSHSPIVVENSNKLTNYGTWSKKRRYNDWSERETLKFYRALSMVGSDFSMMETMFKKRTRHELKLKFKKEEKSNPALVDKCLSQTGGQFADIKDFLAEDSDEDDAEKEEKVDRPGRGRKRKSKTSTSKRNKYTSRGNWDSSSGAEDADVSESSRSPAARKRLVQQLQKRNTHPAPAQSQSRVSSAPHAQTPSSVPLTAREPPPAVERNVSPTPLKKLPGVHFPPALLAANPSLAGAKPGSLVVVASPSKTDPNSQLLHVYMVSEKKSKSNVPRTLSPSPTPPRNSSPANRNRTSDPGRLSIDPAVVRAVDRKRSTVDRNQRIAELKTQDGIVHRRQRTMSEGNMISPSRLRNLSGPRKDHNSSMDLDDQQLLDRLSTSSSFERQLSSPGVSSSEQSPSVSSTDNSESVPTNTDSLPIARKSKPVP